MKAYLPVLQLARKGLYGLAGVVLVGGGVLVGLDQLVAGLKNRLAQEQSALQTQLSLLETRQSDLTNVRLHIQRYDSLRTQGLVGEPDRALWVEQLQMSHRQVGGPDGLTIQLQAPKQLNASGLQAGLEADAAHDPAQPSPLAHDLQFELRNAVETDVLQLLQNYRAQVTGRFRVQLCKLSDPKDSGLIAQCVLRFVTIPLATP